MRQTVLATMVVLALAGGAHAQRQRVFRSWGGRSATRAAPREAPTTRPARPDVAAELLQDARAGKSAGDVALFVRRAEILLELALREDPALAEAWQLLAEARESRGDLDGAAEAQAQYLKIAGQADHQAMLRWLGYVLATMPTAGQRLAALREMVAAPGRTDAQRAVALARIGAILENDGRGGPARKAYEQALRLEPTERLSLEGMARVGEARSPAQRAADAVAMLQGNPLAINVAWELAQLCRAHGLHELAVRLYDYALAVARVTGHFPSQEFRRDMLDALLDAGQTQRAIGDFGDEADAMPVDLGMVSLLAEAYRQAGQTDKLEYAVERMNEAYGLRQTVAKVPGPVAAELAWFHTRYRDRQLPARNWADMAMQKTPNDPLARRVWAQLYLRSSDEAQARRARELLEALASRDAYALGDLVELDARQGLLEQAARRLTLAGALPRQGPSWRYLSSVALRHRLPLAARTDAGEAIAARVEGFFRRGLADLALQPEKHVAVTLEPPADAAGPGRALSVTAVLTNIGAVPVPLGEWGLLTPRLLVTVELQADQGRPGAQARVPLLWAAPRFLSPGQSIRQSVRVDVDEVGLRLVQRPLHEATLTVGGILDPVDRRGKLEACLKPVTVPDVTISRAPLIESLDAGQYSQALDRLQAALRGSDPSAAEQAVAATAHLSGVVQMSQSDRLMLLGELGKQLDQERVLEMLRYSLQEAPTPVRIAALEHLGRMALTDQVGLIMAPCLAHEDPVVRALAVDMLGRQDAARFAGVLESFARQDADPLVRRLAECFLAARAPASAPATMP